MGRRRTRSGRAGSPGSACLRASSGRVPCGRGGDQDVADPELSGWRVAHWPWTPRLRRGLRSDQLSVQLERPPARPPPCRRPAPSPRLPPSPRCACGSRPLLITRLPRDARAAPRRGRRRGASRSRRARSWACWLRMRSSARPRATVPPRSTSASPAGTPPPQINTGTAVRTPATRATAAGAVGPPAPPARSPGPPAPATGRRAPPTPGGAGGRAAALAAVLGGHADAAPDRPAGGTGLKGNTDKFVGGGGVGGVLGRLGAFSGGGTPCRCFRSRFASGKPQCR